MELFSEHSRVARNYIFSVTGFVAGILALMIPFAFGWMGAGDVKLFAAVGALLGYKTLPRVFFYSCIVAGVIALIALALGQARQISFKHFWTDCKFMFLTLRIGLPNSTAARLRCVLSAMGCRNRCWYNYGILSRPVGDVGGLLVSSK